MFRKFTSSFIHKQSTQSRNIQRYGMLWIYNSCKCHRSHSLASSNTNTVYSLSSGTGKSGVAVIRVSGPSSSVAIQKLCKSDIKPRRASVQRLFHPETNDLLDKALVLWFPAPRSFTGEDCAEFHVHGGPAVIEAVLNSLASLPGLRPAVAGEFTKQAFINGKLDLTEVEGLGDLIHAETEAQRKQALRQLEGDLGQLYTTWRTRLIKCLANVEAYIDFAEEENIEDDVLQTVHNDVIQIKQEIFSHLRDSRRGERLREGVRVTIAGMPNAGKSTVLNLLTQRPAAIVSPIAGTTRDVVETALNIGGFPVLMSDTAGLRVTQDPIEKEGVIRALDRIRSADLKVLLIDSSDSKDCLNAQDSSTIIKTFVKDLNLNNMQEGNETRNTHRHSSVDSGQDVNTSDCPLFSSSDTLIVFNKVDLVEELDTDNQRSDSVCWLSCSTGQGMEEFIETLVKKISELCGNPLEGPPSLTQTRHRFHLKACLEYLDNYLLLEYSDDVLAAERLRLATREIGQITGSVSAEDILDILFKDFCIGK